ncbi:MAG TPA: hypothetical protein VGO47_10030 [Chlamydiales bacterium]|nr:hypothetical protein [Chlamydiales bacterium]
MSWRLNSGMNMTLTEKSESLAVNVTVEYTSMHYGVHEPPFERQQANELDTSTGIGKTNGMSQLGGHVCETGDVPLNIAEWH